jgi:hypothetical protein
MKTPNLQTTKAIALGLFAALLTACGGGKDDPPPPAPAPPIVQVSVQASDANGSTLHYEWRVTEGTIVAADAPTTRWTLPAGPGLHFAYVLIGNGKGGYTERRVAVSTDDIGVAKVVAPAKDFDAPPAAAPTGSFYASVIRGSGYYQPTPDVADNGIYISGAEAYLQLQNSTTPTATAISDARGQFLIANVPPGTYDLYCTLEPGLTPADICENSIVIANEASFDPYQGPQSGRGEVVGRLVLADGAACGMVNSFFGKTVVGRATLLDGTGAVIEGPYPLNAFGHYGFSKAGAAVKLECEGAAPVTEPVVAGESKRTVLLGTSAPVVTGMSAKLDTKEVGLFLPPPSGVPADYASETNLFLAFKGLDTRLGACKYYQAIGAVTGCGADGSFTGAIGFEDWKRKLKLEPYATGGRKDVVATYINQVDLNLTRKHHSISYGPGQVAGYVCNHLGPANDTQPAVDTAIDNAVKDRNLVACVAMDYGVTKGVNGDRPYTRFMIFGPSGQLLPSVNLDGRGEKFMPGVCVACHGGDKYLYRYPTDGTGAADIGAYFLPYDTGNFAYSTKAALTEAAQELAIHDLNQNALQAGPNVAIQELVNGWYAHGTTLDKDYLPATWVGKTAVELDFYKKVYSRSCRTCHVAFTENLNFDHYANLANEPSPVMETGSLRINLSVCGGSSSWLRTYSMPNSLNTMNRFWASAGTAADQPAALDAFLGNVAPDLCKLVPSPVP